MFGIFKRREPWQPSTDQVLLDFEVNIEMARQGWRFWKANATDAEKIAAIEAYIDGKPVQWYPPGFIEPPIITEGKLIIGSKGAEKSWKPSL